MASGTFQPSYCFASPLQLGCATMANADECQAAFDQLAANNSLPAANIGEAARLAGACPSVAEVEEFKKKAGGGCNFADFKAFCDKTLHNEDDKKDMAELFRSTDLSDSGTVPRAAMKMLQKFGEALTEAEYEAVLKDFTKKGTDDVDYALMLTRIFQ